MREPKIKKIEEKKPKKTEADIDAWLFENHDKLTRKELVWKLTKMCTSGQISSSQLEKWLKQYCGLSSEKNLSKGEYDPNSWIEGKNLIDEF